MALPANLSVITVHGQYVDFNGNPISGQVVFTPPSVLQDPALNVIVVPLAPITATLVAGEFTVNLPATDDPDLSPVGWAYQVSEKFSGGRTFSIEVPSNTPAGTTLELSDIAPVVPSPGNVSYVLKATVGAPGGVASLDSQGHVPLTQMGGGNPSALTYLDGTGNWTVPAGGGGGGGGGVSQVNGVNPDAFGRVTLTPANIGAVATSAVGTTVASLSGGKVPVSQLPAGTANGVASLDASAKVPVAQIPDLSGSYVAVSQRAVPNGVATLDAGGKVPGAQVPDLSSTYVNINRLGAVNGVASLDATGKIPATQVPDLSSTYVNVNQLGVASGVATLSATGKHAAGQYESHTPAVIQYTGSAYPNRSTATSDTTRPVIWKGPNAPTAGGSFAVDGIDIWIHEA